MLTKGNLTTVVFGVGLDGVNHPEVPSQRGAAAFEAVLGPSGLLAAVEQALGLTGPISPSVHRIAGWRAKLAAADNGERFWSESFAQDPLATARTTLGWRDALITSGWTPSRLTSPPPRLADMAAAEMTGEALLPGFADRLMAAINAINTAGAPPPVQLLLLVDERAKLPVGLASLIAALENAGTIVEPAEPLDVVALGDLGQIQAQLRLGGRSILKGDGYFVLLTAESELAAAEVLADWLVGSADERGTIVVVAEQPTSVLDAALRRRHAPRLGIGDPSPLRGVLQALPLSFALRWYPFDPLRALELLQMPRGPIPFDVARMLARVLTETPGRGGTRWSDAMDAGWKEYTARLERETEEESARRRVERARRRVDLLLGAPLANPGSGLGVDEIGELAGALAQWVVPRIETGDVQASVLASACTALTEAVRETGLGTVPRLELERLLDEVLAEGVENPDLAPEAAPWTVVRTPAAVWGPAERVVWWTLGMPTLPARLPWDASERNALAAAGCRCDDPLDALSLIDAGWRRPLLAARRRAVLVTVNSKQGDRAGSHPLIQELWPVLEKAPPAAVARAETLLDVQQPLLLGKPLPRAPVAKLATPTPRRDWEFPSPIAVRRTVESATSIELLLGCPYAWISQHVLGLFPGRRAEIPAGERLAGILAHRLVQLLMPPGPPGDPDLLAQQASQRLPKLMEEEAAPMLTPGAAAERARVVRDLPQALRALAQLLHQHGLSIKGVEVERSAKDMPEAGDTLRGIIDLLLANECGRPVVFDMKWSARDRWRRRQLTQGNAIQLAAYSRLVDAAEDAGFFMLAQQQLLTIGGDVLPGSVAGPTLLETWERAKESRRRRLATLDGGIVRALGVGYDTRRPPPDPDDSPLAPEPPCRFCRLGHLCGREMIR